MLSDRAAAALAVYLRLQPSRWRVRRVDHYAPLSFHLAEQSTTLHFEIDAGLLQDFCRTAPPGLDVGEGIAASEWKPTDGDCIRLYVPILHQQKPFLVNFSARTSDNQPLPIITRAVGSPISAAYMRAIIDRTSRDAAPSLYGQLDELLNLLAYLNPYVLDTALRAFMTRKGLWSSDQIVTIGSSVWYEWLRAVGTELGLDPPHQLPDALLTSSALLEFNVRPPLWGQAEDLASFSALSTLSTLAVGDFLELSRRRGDPVAILDAGSRIVDGLNALSHAIRQAERVQMATGASSTAESGGLSHLVWSHVHGWTMYGICDIIVGRPTIIKISETASVSPSTYGRGERRLASRSTPFDIPLVIEDARSLHVEVSLRDPELRFHRDKFAVLSPIQSPTKPAEDEPSSEELRVNAGVELRSEQVVHFYDDRRVDDANHPFDTVEPPVLRVYIRLTQTVYWCYLIATLGLVVGNLVVWYEWAHAVRNRISPNDPTVIASISVLGVTVGLWLISAIGKTQLTHKKLVWLRYGLLVGAAMLVLANALGLGAIGAHRLIWDGNESRVPHVCGTRTHETQSHHPALPEQLRHCDWRIGRR